MSFFAWSISNLPNGELCPWAVRRTLHKVASRLTPILLQSVSRLAANNKNDENQNSQVTCTVNAKSINKLTPWSIFPSGCIFSMAAEVWAAIMYRSLSKLGWDTIRSLTHLTKVATTSIKPKRTFSSSSTRFSSFPSMKEFLCCERCALLKVDVDWDNTAAIECRCFSSQAFKDSSKA